MLRSGALAGALLAVVATIACSSAPPVEPMKLDGNRLTINNTTPTDWSNVQIWLNRSFRVTAASIPAGGRFDTTLDSFVSGYGQRFDFRRMQIRDLRLEAKLPDGKPFEMTKELQEGGLAGALHGMSGKR